MRQVRPVCESQPDQNAGVVMRASDLRDLIRWGLAKQGAPSRTHLAEWAGISLDTLARWEAGDRLEMIVAFLTMAEALGYQLQNRPGFYTDSANWRTRALKPPV